MGWIGRSRNREHDGGPLEEPGQRDLSSRRVVGLGDPVEEVAVFGQIIAVDRGPRDEADPRLVTDLEYLPAAAVVQVVPVLDGFDLDLLAGPIEEFRGDVTDADRVDEASSLSSAKVATESSKGVSSSGRWN